MQNAQGKYDSCECRWNKEQTHGTSSIPLTSSFYRWQELVKLDDPPGELDRAVDGDHDAGADHHHRPRLWLRRHLRVRACPQNTAATTIQQQKQQNKTTTKLI